MPDVTIPSAPALARINRVELIRAGVWDISTGSWDCSAEDLKQAVAALECPAVRRPHIKLGHSDPRFNDGDGQPTIGWVDNLTVTASGDTLVGDYVGMPGWLGQIMASAYPDRSVEGFYNHRCQLGHTHPFVLTAVALLGVTPPGVGTLKSLQDVASLYGVAAEAEPAEGSVFVEAHMPGGPVEAKPAGKETHPGTTEHLMEWWAHGDGAKRIGWGTPGSYDRCIVQLGKHVQNGKELHGLCANLYHRATGDWPGKHGDHHKTTASADGSTPMPNPKPLHVAASTTVDDIREEYYESAPDRMWIREIQLDPLQLIVCDEQAGEMFRVPVTIGPDGEPTFGDPVPVEVTYTDAAAGDVEEPGVAASAKRIVYASATESRPPGPEDPGTPAPDPNKAEPASVPDTTHPAGPPTVPAPRTPAAEPDNPPTQEDEMSLSEIRSRLSLPGDADDAAVLAALDDVIDKATAPPAAVPQQPVAASLPEGVVMVDKATLDELKVNAAAGAKALTRQATEDRDRFIAAAVQDGKIPPARKEAWTVAYDKDPEGTRQYLGQIEAGLVVPVTAKGSMGDAEATEDIDAEYAGLFSTPFRDTKAGA